MVHAAQWTANLELNRCTVKALLWRVSGYDGVFTCGMVRMLLWDMEFENGRLYLVYPPDVIIDLLLFELCILSCCYSNSIAKLDRKFGRVKRISRGGLTCSIMPNRRGGERW